jgi:hypothetical protein
MLLWTTLTLLLLLLFLLLMLAPPLPPLPPLLPLPPSLLGHLASRPKSPAALQGHSHGDISFPFDIGSDSPPLLSKAPTRVACMHQQRATGARAPLRQTVDRGGLARVATG